MTEAREIPEDVMERAREAFEELRDLPRIEGWNALKQFVVWEYEDAVSAIARALMEERAAERERAAKIAKDKAKGHMDATPRAGTDYNYHVGAWKACNEVADAIRGQP